MLYFIDIYWSITNYYPLKFKNRKFLEYILLESAILKPSLSHYIQHIEKNIPIENAQPQNMDLVGKIRSIYGVA